MIDLMQLFDDVTYLGDQASQILERECRVSVLVVQEQGDPEPKLQLDFLWQEDGNLPTIGNHRKLLARSTLQQTRYSALVIESIMQGLRTAVAVPLNLQPQTEGKDHADSDKTGRGDD